MPGSVPARNSRAVRADPGVMATAPRAITGPPPLRLPKGPAPTPRVAFAGVLGVLRKRDKATTEVSPARRPAAPPPDASTAEPAPKPPELDALDPLLRVLGAPYSAAPLSPSPPPPPTGAPTTKPTDTQLATSLERASDVLEKVALWGDGHSGVARLRFDGRARAGLSAASVTLEHRDGVLSIAAEGADPATLDELRARLRARGIVVEE